MKIVRSNVLLVLLAVALLPASASGQTGSYPPQACGLKVSRSVVKRGQTLVVSSCGFQAFNRVRLELRQSQRKLRLGTTRADGRGQIRRRVRIPHRAHAGRSLITATGRNVNGRMVTRRAVVRVR
jgi:hypothetical protein